MPKILVTRQMVFATANKLAKLGIMPTVIGIKQDLDNKGSNSTVHKYLNQWKIKLLHNVEVDATNPLNHHQPQELLEVQKLLSIEQKKNAILANELAKTEKLKLDLSAKSASLEQENTNLKQLNIDLVQEKDKFQGLYQEISLERELAIEKILTDKNALIDSLRQELATINAASIKQIQDISFGINDSLIQEKVKAINLQDKIETLSKRVQELSLELETAKRKAHE